MIGPGPAVRRECRSREAGFSLVELLLAMVLSAGLLAGAWGWTWTIARASADGDDAQELRSAAAFAERTLSADVHGMCALVTETAPGCTRSSLVLRVREDDDVRDVPVVYDSVRGLLWRLTSSCHLVDGISTCRFAYLDERGAELDCANGLSPAQAAQVRRITLHLVLRRGRAVVETTWTAALEGGGL
jgi:prepilin-type N-terminal cleavage/methylation domain-containing protein